MTVSLSDRLDTSYPELSPQEQRAADFMREHLADLAIYNATEVAQLSGVSKATISRLYRRLGFESAEELRDHVRAVRAGTPVAVAHPTDLSQHLAREIANLSAALSGLDVAAVAARIAGARRVLVVGFRTSYTLAQHLRQQLAQARDGVSLAPAPGQTVAEELVGLSSSDVVVIIGFRRRPEGFTRLVDALASREVPTILLTDATGRRFRDRVTHLVECPVDSVSSFDSYAAASSVVSVLASAVLTASRETGRARVAAIGGMFDELAEIEG